MDGAGASFVSPTGYVDLDNDCQYSIDLKSTRSREYIDPKEDLAFFFNTYIVPKYGLENINVSNVASFMKDLEMNWSRLTPQLKDKVLDIMVDGIFTKDNYDFKRRFLAKLGINELTPPSPVVSNNPSGPSKSNFGSSQDMMSIGIFLVIVVIVVLMIFFIKPKMGGFPKMI